jgi:hypothetical protein
VFIDAAAAGPEPFSFEAAVAQADASATSHALSPAAVLDAYRRVTGAPLPAAYVLGVRGYAFELGADLCGAAAANLDAALQMLVARLAATTVRAANARSGTPQQGSGNC